MTDAALTWAAWTVALAACVVAWIIDRRLRAQLRLAQSVVDSLRAIIRAQEAARLERQRRAWDARPSDFMLATYEGRPLAELTSAELRALMHEVMPNGDIGAFYAGRLALLKELSRRRKAGGS